MLYLVTADSTLKIYKVGFWSGTYEKLWARYLTYYGPDMEFRLFKCDNIEDERQVHKDLAHHRIVGSRELYQDESYDKVRAYLVARFGEPRMYDKNGLEPIFTMQDLTREYILERLTPVITQEVVEAGLEAITQIIVKNLLQKDYGKYCYYCPDKKAMKFKMCIDREGMVIEEADPNSISLRSKLAIPLQMIVSEIAEKTTVDSVQKTYGEVVELENYGGRFSMTLASSLPATPDGSSLIKRVEVDDTEIRKKLEEKRLRIAEKIRLKKFQDMCN